MSTPEPTAEEADFEVGTPKPSAQHTPRSSALRNLLLLRIALGVSVVGLAALGWRAFQWHASLNIAILIFGGFVLVQVVASYWWQRQDLTDEQARSAQADAVKNPHVDAAKLAITTQGVVLGLISFSGLAKLDITVKVGAASLALGVMLGSIMYLLVARVPPITPRQQSVASVLLSLLLYALSFGLLCVVAGSWSGT